MLTETRAGDSGSPMVAGPGPGSSSAGFLGVSDRSVDAMSVAERTRLVRHVHEHWEKMSHVVPHVKQTYNWDCGLACVLMVVRALGASAHHCDLRTLRQLCRTTSIWTVDLAYLLRKFGADVTFTTVTMGANPEYASESFYRDNLREDGERVDALFQNARANGITIERESLSLDAIKAYAGGGEYIVTFEAWPSARPHDNNVDGHDGNPPLAMFACETDQVFEGESPFCELEDVVEGGATRRVPREHGRVRVRAGPRRRGLRARRAVRALPAQLQRSRRVWRGGLRVPRRKRRVLCTLYCIPRGGRRWEAAARDST